MEKIIFSIGLFLLLPPVVMAGSFWNSYDRGYLVKDECNKIKSGKFIYGSIGPKKPIDKPDDQRFQIFYYTAQPLDQRKRFLLAIDGGPGHFSTGTYSVYDKLFSNHNVVYFHIRSAGCSYYPESTEYDQHLNSYRISEDIERIRLDLKIQKWDIIIGESYGTRLARLYTHYYPTSVNALILDEIKQKKA